METGKQTEIMKLTSNFLLMDITELQMPHFTCSLSTRETLTYKTLRMRSKNKKEQRSIETKYGTQRKHDNGLKTKFLQAISAISFR